MTTTFYIIRHGESEGNVFNRIGGDFVLTEKGKEQAKKTAQDLQSVLFDAIFTSSKKRAKETAEILAAGRTIPLIEMPILRERDYGEYDGKTKDQYITDLPETFRIYNEVIDFKERWTYKYYPTYESDQECASRFVIALNDILKTHAGECVAVVSHGSVMRVILMELGIIPATIMHRDIVVNAGWIKIETDGKHYKMIEGPGLKLPEGPFDPNPSSI